MLIFIMDNLRKQFWERICKLRKEKDLSQERLWQIAKIHRTYISEIERGEANLTLEHIGRLAQALWVDLSDLFKL